MRPLAPRVAVTEEFVVKCSKKRGSDRTPSEPKTIRRPLSNGCVAPALNRSHRYHYRGYPWSIEILGQGGRGPAMTQNRPRCWGNDGWAKSVRGESGRGNYGVWGFWYTVGMSWNGSPHRFVGKKSQPSYLYPVPSTGGNPFAEPPGGCSVGWCENGCERAAGNEMVTLGGSQGIWRFELEQTLPPAR